MTNLRFKKISLEQLILAVILIIFLYTAVITAWLSDDSFITLKQVLNTINYHEISWRIGERIQAFTHPAWFLLLLLIITITHEIFFTTIIISILLSVASLFFIYKYIKINNLNIFLLLNTLLLAFSKAFTDFMTSGLENSLSYFLTGFIICQSYFVFNNTNKINFKNHNKNIILLYLAFACLILNRLDCIPLMSPLALYLFFFKIGIKKWKLLIPGSLLLLTWFCFATIYFGSPLANSFYAKDFTGYLFREYLLHGVDYFLVTFRHDPMILIIIFFGLAAGFIIKTNNFIVNKLLSIGMINYLAYILISGGDFMQGRFFAELAYIAIFNMIMLLHWENTQTAQLLSQPSTQSANLSSRPSTQCAEPGSIRNKLFTIIFLTSIIIVLPFSSKPFLSFINYRNDLWDNGIADERGWYYQSYGLLAEHRTAWPKINIINYNKQDQAYYQTRCAPIGLAGLTRPDITWIDSCGLTDAFVTKLPPKQENNWRIGHIERKIPAEYGDFLINKNNKILNSDLQYILNDITVLRSGPIWGDYNNFINRLKTIIRFNLTGDYKYNQSFVSEVNKNNLIYEVDINKQPLANGTILDHNKALKFNNQIYINVHDLVSSGLELSLDNSNSYEIIINKTVKFYIKSVHNNLSYNNLMTHTIKFPNDLTVHEVLIKREGGKGVFAVGHLILKPASIAAGWF